MASFMPARARILLTAAAVGVAVAASVADDRSDELHSWQAAWEAQPGAGRRAARGRTDPPRLRAPPRPSPTPGCVRSRTPCTRRGRTPLPMRCAPWWRIRRCDRALQRELRQRREEAFRRATGLPLRTGLSVHPVPKRSGDASTADRRFVRHVREFPPVHRHRPSSGPHRHLPPPSPATWCRSSPRHPTRWAGRASRG